MNNTSHRISHRFIDDVMIYIYIYRILQINNHDNFISSLSTLFKSSYYIYIVAAALVYNTEVFSSHAHCSK